MTGCELAAWYPSTPCRAFTVGAIANEGRTRLELEVAKLESAPREFRDR